MPVYAKAVFFLQVKIQNVLNHFVNSYNNTIKSNDSNGNTQLYVDTAHFGRTTADDPNANYWNPGRVVTASLGFRF